VTPEQEQHAAEALAYEEQTEEQSTAVLAAEVAVVAVLVMNTWQDVQAGGPFAPLVTAIRRFSEIIPSVTEALMLRSVDGVRLGIDQGMRTLGHHPGWYPKLNGPVSDFLDPELKAAVSGANGTAWQVLSDAVELARSYGLDLRERENITAVVGKAHTSVSRSKATARWVANRAVSAGTSAVARASGSNLLWVAERNGCLDCLAYSGWVTEPGKPFHKVSFATKPMPEFGVQLYPPRHPNCRCQVEVTDLPPGRSDLNLAREAERSVARGLSDFESEKERLRAADKLVKGVTLLPKSVVARAVRNIGDQRFKNRPVE